MADFPTLGLRIEQLFSPPRITTELIQLGDLCTGAVSKLGTAEEIDSLYAAIEPMFALVKENLPDLLNEFIAIRDSLSKVQYNQETKLTKLLSLYQLATIAITAKEAKHDVSILKGYGLGAIV